MAEREHRILQPHEFDDTWHKNDTIYRIRDLSCESLCKVMAELPSASDWTFKGDLAEVKAIDPVNGAKYAVTFQRRDIGARSWRWFLYQVVKES